MTSALDRPESARPASFLPDQAAVHAEVFAALSGSGSGAGDSDAHSLLARLQPGLRDLFRTREQVIIGNCTATGFVEAAIRNGVEQRVLVLIGGADGERLAQMAEACGKEVVRAVVSEGRTMEPEYLARFLEGPEVDAVALVHAETSTGALSPLAELAVVVRARPGVMLLVDGSSAIGGLPVETDAWGLDFVFTGSSQALALPAGLSLGVASTRLLARAVSLPDRGRYFDLPALHASALRDEFLEAPALPLFRALERQLDRIAAAGGLEARWRRHYELLLAVEGWVATRPNLRFLSQEGRRSWTVSCLRLPAQVAASSLIERLAARGIHIAPGIGRFQETAIRIGHMGETTPEELEALLQLLEVEIGD